jgi:hypothetical protein
MTRPISSLAGDPNAVSFPPIICDIAYILATELGVARMHLHQPGTQWTVQSAIQRVINALAAQEKDGAISASDTLKSDSVDALADRNGMAEMILDRFRSPDVRSRSLGLATEILGRFRSPDVRSRSLDRVKTLLSRPTPSQFEHLRSLEQQGLKIQMLPDGTSRLVGPLDWLVRAEDFPSPLREVLIPVLREANDAISVPWKICRLCARPFPQVRIVAKACPPCRRRQKPLQVHRRLRRAPEHPVIFEALPPDARESVRLVIADGVRAPSSLTRISKESVSRRFAGKVHPGAVRLGELMK